VLLLERGASANHVNKHGTTALIRASTIGHANAVRALLDHGADPETPDQDGFKALWSVQSSNVAFTLFCFGPSWGLVLS